MADLGDLLAIRREALERDPCAFSADAASDVGLDADFMRSALGRRDEQAIFGAFDGETMVGIVGVRRLPSVKEAHKALLWGMYVRDSARGEGLGRTLLDAAVGFAGSLPGVSHLHLSASATAVAARHLYRNAGFVTWGVEAAALQVDGRQIDVHHMALDLAEHR